MLKDMQELGCLPVGSSTEDARGVSVCVVERQLSTKIVWRACLKTNWPTNMNHPAHSNQNNQINSRVVVIILLDCCRWSGRSATFMERAILEIMSLSLRIYAKSMHHNIPKSRSPFLKRKSECEGDFSGFVWLSEKMKGVIELYHSISDLLLI